MKRTFHYRVKEDIWNIDLILNAEIINEGGVALPEKFDALQDDLFSFLFDRFHSTNIREIK